MLIYTVNVQPKSSQRHVEQPLTDVCCDEYLQEMERKNNQHTLTSNHNKQKSFAPETPLPDPWDEVPPESLASSLTSLPKGYVQTPPMEEVNPD